MLQKRLNDCVQLLDAYKAGEKVDASDRELWQAQKVTLTIHCAK